MIHNFTDLEPKVKRTLLIDVFRSVFNGIIETSSAFFILLLGKIFQSGFIEKSIATSGVSFGLILTPFVIFFASRLKVNPSKSIGWMLVLSSLFAASSSLFNSGILVAVSLALALAIWASCIPFQTEIYSSNYSEDMRGKLFSIAQFFKFLSVIYFGHLLGELLGSDSYNYKYLPMIYAICFLVLGLTAFLYPCAGSRFENKEVKFLSGFNALKTDKYFRLIIISWMLLGLGTLMLFPLRVEYLSNPRFGFSMNESNISLLVLIIPNFMRLIFTFFWGYLFDKINFFRMRMIINLLFVFSALTFFLVSSFNFLVLASILFGISVSGGDVAWNLWTTKFAPPGKNSIYMSVHTFFTGIRGIISPLVAFKMSETYGHISALSLALIFILVSTAVIYKERNVRTFL